MPQENYQKIKLLKIMEILRQETDEEHPMGSEQKKVCVELNIPKLAKA